MWFELGFLFVNGGGIQVLQTISQEVGNYFKIHIYAFIFIRDGNRLQKMIIS